MSNTIPVWLLDVDGVINGFGLSGEESAIAAPASVNGNTGGVFLLNWRRKVVEFIALAIESQAVEVRWATTWVPWADEIERIFDLPLLGTAWFPEDQAYGDVPELKERAAVAVLEDEKRPLIWTDDDIVPRKGTGLHARLSQAPSLLIRPDDQYGLTDDDLEAISAFVLRHTGVGILDTVDVEVVLDRLKGTL